jgi:hypothetical protein
MKSLVYLFEELFFKSLYIPIDNDKDFLESNERDFLKLLKNVIKASNLNFLKAYLIGFVAIIFIYYKA